MQDKECITIKISEGEDGLAHLDFHFGEGGIDSWEGTNAGLLLKAIANVISKVREAGDEQEDK